jgi:hypothetical protein
MGKSTAKSTCMCAVTGLCLMAALLPAARSSWAQAGNTGGALGRTDKSASDGACDRATGVWLWKWLRQTNVVTLNADGTGTNKSNGARSTWTCADGTVVIRWPLSRDTVVLSSDGTKLTGSSMPLGNPVSGSRL